MSINFTKAVIGQLQREIADIESIAGNLKQKKNKAQAKIKQLQRDMKLSQSSSDLSSKLTRVTKQNDEIQSIGRALAELDKQLAAKKSLLQQQLAKSAQRTDS